MGWPLVPKPEDDEARQAAVGRQRAREGDGIGISGRTNRRGVGTRGSEDGDFGGGCNRVGRKTELEGRRRPASRDHWMFLETNDAARRARDALAGVLLAGIIGGRPQGVVVPRLGTAAMMAGMRQPWNGRAVARAVPRRRRRTGRRKRPMRPGNHQVGARNSMVPRVMRAEPVGMGGPRRTGESDRHDRSQHPDPQAPHSISFPDRVAPRDPGCAYETPTPGFCSSTFLAWYASTTCHPPEAVSL
jgi:hypothetical protein